ncbi:methylmalonyl Co-A mutase-associated GTPase MeaB [Martelella alba]|uniref:Methylmalonyl Co-A mutase-associated GTPase MeaB n=1 Tax=Martelella alba TaxID=2590451 RepID=A0ABY2SPJ1_9HYPH|nr:methylmalonyl Co-A mutase-associated GTPase MeaB [Martelella alba]TKI07926.1 methylmalonyl Co-A mutase-associated GTPase MeaB [Martelella alba]
MISADTLDSAVERLLAGDRVALAQAMTLVESTHPAHQALAARLLDTIMPHTGQARRIGITGVPGAGKSTFLEALGGYLLQRDFKVAIIAIDPSSPLSGGSILGDKTRMLTLARSERAFIRPVPAGGHLGGTSRRTRELMLLCEAAKYDAVIVETVGVGQSEVEIAHLVDCFLSLQLAGAGDELQGIKKGIMEMADIIVINKDDGENHSRVMLTRQIYQAALHIMRRKYPDWPVPVLTCSALEQRGIDEVWRYTDAFYQQMAVDGQLEALRRRQYLESMHKQIEETVLQALFARRDIQDCYQRALQQVDNHHLSPRAAVNGVVEFICGKISD